MMSFCVLAFQHMHLAVNGVRLSRFAQWNLVRTPSLAWTLGRQSASRSISPPRALVTSQRMVGSSIGSVVASLHHPRVLQLSRDRSNYSFKADGFAAA